MEKAIDCWMNAGLTGRPRSWQKQAARMFGREEADLFRAYSAEELVDIMDSAGVERAVLTLRLERPDRSVLKAAERYPERFLFSAIADPRRGMKTLRELEALRGSEPLVLARVMPSLLALPPDDRAYYPLYAKCVELDLPVSVNTGIPGPPLPARYQDPLHLDEVCLFFPELTLVMAHGADPWWSVAIRLMGKYPNLRLMTSAYAPRALPEELLRFMNGRGRGQILFATDFPFLTPGECLQQARELALEQESLTAYVRGNAARLFGLADDETAES